MKRWFANLSIRHKLSTIVLFASTVALVLATVFSFFIQHYFIRQQLRDEILKAISKHMQVDDEKVSIKMERGAQVSTLAVDIEIPFDAGKKAA